MAGILFPVAIILIARSKEAPALSMPIASLPVANILAAVREPALPYTRTQEALNQQHSGAGTYSPTSML